MKKILFLLMVTSSMFSQSKIEFTKDGITPVVTEIEGMTAEELYNKTKEWLQISYKNPSKVIGGDIPNEMIRINGFGETFFRVKFLQSYDYDLNYSIEFNFKDGKYKFNFISDRISHPRNAVGFDEKDFFKKEGGVRKVYKVSYETYLKSVESLYKSHYEYVIGKTSENKKDW